MTIRKIIITDHSPEQGGLLPEKVLEIEIRAFRKQPSDPVKTITEMICSAYMGRADHSIIVEDISSTRNLVYTKGAWEKSKTGS